MQRVGGIIQVQTGGVIQDAKGEFTFNLGAPLVEPVVGQDSVHGYKETPQPAYIEGSITDRGTLDVKALVTAKNVTVTVKLANGKTVVLRNGVFAGDGNVTTGEGEIAVRWVARSAQEISA